MPIDTTCPSCQRTLRVADEHAGKQARCPVCSQMYTVPSNGASPSAFPASTSTSAGSEVVGESPQAKDTTPWSLKTPEGAIYGPVDRATLDRWLADGRIASDCYLAEGNSGSWRRAAEIYPQLSAQTSGPHAPFHEQDSNPYQSPRTSTVGFQGVGSNIHLRPHRGGLILALGILGLMSCQILGIMAWLMGSDDLKEIRAGRMDPSGEGLTQAGTVLGMICAILTAISLVGALLSLFIFAAMAAAN